MVRPFVKNVNSNGDGNNPAYAARAHSTTVSATSPSRMRLCLMRETPIRNGRTASSDGRPTILQLRQSSLHRLLTMARRDHPLECCGILVGERIGKGVRVSRVVAGRNIATGDQENTYQLDWPTLFSTIRAARATGDEIVGFYHSHPDGSQEPSQRDHHEAWLDYSYLILGAPFDDARSAVSWRILDPRVGFERERLWVVSDGCGGDDSLALSDSARGIIGSFGVRARQVGTASSNRPMCGEAPARDVVDTKRA